MYYAVRPKRETPTPFAEIRAFQFFRKRPARRMLEAVRVGLERAVDDMEKTMEGLQTGIELGVTGVWQEQDMEIVAPTRITLVPPTERRKVMIEGLEVEEVDADEMRPQNYEGIFISERLTRRRALEYRYFTRNTEADVTEEDYFLSLEFDRIYRYFAKFDEEGNIVKDYDEGEIKQRLEPARKTRELVEALAERIRVIVTTLREADIARDIERLRNLQDLLRRLRR